MAFIDVISYHGPHDALIWHWLPESKRGRREEEIRLGSQLVVGPSFVAVFVAGGEIADIFGPGTYTLSTRNLPILDRLVSLPFGKESPFKAEVYFINKSVQMDTQFSIPAFNMLDPNFRVPIPLEVNGSFAFRAGEAKSFLTNLMGSLKLLDKMHIQEYFTGIITEQVKSAVSKAARELNLNPMELEASVGEVADVVKPTITAVFAKYGLKLELFNIKAISIVDDDPNVKRVIDNYHKLMSDDMAERMRLKRRKENLDVYKVERTFDTTEKAAENISGGLGDAGGGSLLGTLVGIGVAQPLANTMTGVMSGALSGATGIKDENTAEKTVELLKNLAQLKDAGVLTEEEFASKKAELLSKLGL